MKVLIAGDIHNEFGILNTLINKKKPDLVICCGDFGYWPRAKNTKKFTDIKLQNSKILWCDGNHEDFWSLNNRTSDEIEPGIIYQPRGSTYTLPDGRIILFMGGAESIDKMYRKIGIDWFPEEIITQKDFQNLPECKIDIIVSHTCPQEIVKYLKLNYPEKNEEPSNIALSELWKIYTPKLWFLGHWHQYMYDTTALPPTEFYCLSAPGFASKWYMWLPEK